MSKASKFLDRIPTSTIVAVAIALFVAVYLVWQLTFGPFTEAVEKCQPNCNLTGLDFGHLLAAAGDILPYLIAIALVIHLHYIHNRTLGGV